MSKIQKTIEKAIDAEVKKGESRADYLTRLAKGLAQMPEADWDKLPKDVQDWYDTYCDAVDKKEDRPDFPDIEAAEEPAPRRRRAAAEDDAPAKSKAYEPSKGDEVIVTSKRGKVTEGSFVEFDGDMIVVAKGDDEIEILRDGASIEPKDAPVPTPEKKHRRSADDEGDAPAPKDPAVGDTVEVTNQRDKTTVGKIIELTDDALVVVKADGEEVEYSKDRIKSIVIKVSAANVDEVAAKSRRKPADEGEAAAGKGDAKEGKPERTRSSNGEGVSVSGRIKEIMLDDPDITEDGVGKVLKKEGLAFRDTTLSMNFKDTKRFLVLLKEKGWKAPK